MSSCESPFCAAFGDQNLSSSSRAGKPLMFLPQPEGRPSNSVAAWSRHGVDESIVLQREFQPARLARQQATQPLRLVVRRALEAEVLHPQRRKEHRLERARLGQRWQIEERQLGPKLLVAADSLVVVDQIARAVEDQPSAIEIEALRIM